MKCPFYGMKCKGMDYVGETGRQKKRAVHHCNKPFFSSYKFFYNTAMFFASSVIADSTFSSITLI